MNRPVWNQSGVVAKPVLTMESGGPGESVTVLQSHEVSWPLNPMLSWVCGVSTRTLVHCSQFQLKTLIDTNRHRPVWKKSGIGPLSADLFGHLVFEFYSQISAPRFKHFSTQFQFATQENRRSGGILMKWFKHYTGASHSEALSIIEAKLGFEGLGRYWRLLEMLFGLWDPCDEPVFRIPKTRIRESLRQRSWIDCESFLDQLTIVPGLKVERFENVYEIKAPILLELLDRDFKRARKERVESAPKTKSKIEIKNKKTTTTVAKPSLRGRSQSDLVDFNSLSELIGAFDQATMTTWAQLYPDNEYLQRQSLKAWDYYRTNSKKTPKNLKGWKRALNHWFESDWPKHVRNIQGVPKSTRIEDLLNEDTGASA